MDDASELPDLERFRAYLLVLARLGLGGRIRRRVGASDIVQETLIEAHAGLSGYRGSCDAELLGWLRRILANNVAAAVRDHRRQKRDVELERSLASRLEQSSRALVDALAADQSTPSGRVAREEMVLRLAEAIAGLPETMQEIVLLHHVEGCSVRSIASDLGLNRYTVARDLRFALARLRERLEDGAS